MDDAKSSLARRALAVLVFAVVAAVALRVVLGVVATVLWIVAVVVLVIAAFWAVSTLKSAKRARDEKRARSMKRVSAGPLPGAPPQDLVEARMRQIKEQLRDQGRL